jgi:hypothetical protein
MINSTILSSSPGMTSSPTSHSQPLLPTHHQHHHPSPISHYCITKPVYHTFYRPVILGVLFVIYLTFIKYSDLKITQQTTEYIRQLEGEPAVARRQFALCQSPSGTSSTSDLIVVSGGRTHSRDFSRHVKGGNDVTTADYGVTNVAGGGDLVPSGSNLEGYGGGRREWVVIVSSADTTEAVIEDEMKDGDEMKGGDAGCVLGYDGKCTSDPAAIVDDGHHITVRA